MEFLTAYSLPIQSHPDPFGMITYGRSWQVGSDYRYGFNGQEQDDDLYGNGKANTAEFWEYDTRLGRRWNVDPLIASFPWNSPYSTLSNNPINRIDPNGDGDYYTKEGKHVGNDKKTVKATNGTVEGDNKAYLTSQETIDIHTVDGVTDWDGVISDPSTKLLMVTNTQLLNIAGKVRNETTPAGVKPTDWREPFAIANALGNYAEFTNDKIQNVVGISLAESDFKVDNNDPYSFVCIAGVINEVTGGFDYSFGAINWDGGDLLARGFSQFHPRELGIEFNPTLYLQYYDFWTTTLPGRKSNRLMSNNLSNPSINFTAGIHQSTSGAVIGAVALKSTVVYNGTVFWAPNKEAHVQIPDGHGGFSYINPNATIDWATYFRNY